MLADHDGSASAHRTPITQTTNLKLGGRVMGVRRIFAPEHLGAAPKVTVTCCSRNPNDQRALYCQAPMLRTGPSCACTILLLSCSAAYAQTAAANAATLGHSSHG